MPSLFDEYFGNGGSLSTMLDRAQQTLTAKDNQANPPPQPKYGARDTVDRLLPEPWWANTRERVKNNINPDVVVGNPYDAHVALERTFKQIGATIPAEIRQRFQSAYTQADVENSRRYSAIMNPEPPVDAAGNPLSPEDVATMKFNEALGAATAPRSNNLWDRLESGLMQVKPRAEFRAQMMEGNNLPPVKNAFDNFLGFLGDTLKGVSGAVAGKGWTDAVEDTFTKMVGAIPADLRMPATVAASAIPIVGQLPGIAKIAEPIDPAHIADALQNHFDPGLDTGSVARSYLADIGAGIIDLANPVGIFGLPGSVWGIAEGLLTPKGRAELRAQIQNDPDSFVRTASSLVFGAVAGHYGPKVAAEIKGVVSERRLNTALGTMQKIVAEERPVDLSPIIDHSAVEKPEFLRDVGEPPSTPYSQDRIIELKPTPYAKEPVASSPEPSSSEPTVGTKSQKKAPKSKVNIEDPEAIAQSQPAPATPEIPAEPTQPSVTQPVEQPKAKTQKAAPKPKQEKPVVAQSEPAVAAEEASHIGEEPVQMEPSAQASAAPAQSYKTGFTVVDSAIQNVNDMVSRLHQAFSERTRRPPGNLSEQTKANLANSTIIRDNLRELYIDPLKQSVETMGRIYETAKARVGDTAGPQEVVKAMSPQEATEFMTAKQQYDADLKAHGAALDRAIAEETGRSVTKVGEDSTPLFQGDTHSVERVTNAGEKGSQTHETLYRVTNNATGEPVLETPHIDQANAHAQMLDSASASSQGNAHLDQVRQQIMDAIDSHDPDFQDPELQDMADELLDADHERAMEIGRRVVAKIKADNVVGADGSVTQVTRRSKQAGGIPVGQDTAQAASAIVDGLNKYKVPLGVGTVLVASTLAPQEARKFVDENLVPFATSIAVLGGLAYMARSPMFKGLTAGRLSALQDLGAAERATEWANRIAVNAGEKVKDLRVTAYRELSGLVGEDFAKLVDQNRALKKMNRVNITGDLRDRLIKTGIAVEDPASGSLMYDIQKMRDLGLIEDADAPFNERGRDTLANKLRVGIRDNTRNPVLRFNLNTLLTNSLKAATGDEAATRALTTAMNGEWIRVADVDAAKAAIDKVQQVVGPNKKALADRTLARYKAAAKDYLDLKAITPEQEPFAALVEHLASNPELEDLKLVEQTGKELEETWRHGENGVLPVRKKIIDPKSRNVVGYEDRWIYSYQGPDGSVRLREVNNPDEIGTVRGKIVGPNDVYARGHLLSPKRAVNVALNKTWAELIAKATAMDRVIGETPELFGADPKEIEAYNTRDTATAVSMMKKLRRFASFSDEEIAMWHQFVRDTVGTEVQESLKETKITESALHDLTAKLGDYLPHAEVFGPSAVRLHSPIGLRLPSYAYDMDLVAALHRQASQVADTLAAHQTWGHGLTKYHDMVQVGEGVKDPGYHDNVGRLVRQIIGAEGQPTPDMEAFQRNLNAVRAITGAKTFFNPFTTALAQLGATAEHITLGNKSAPQLLPSLRKAKGILQEDLVHGQHQEIVSREGYDDLHGAMGILERTNNASHWGVDTEYGDLAEYKAQLNPPNERVAKAKAREQAAVNVFNRVSRGTALHAFDLAPRHVMAEAAFDGAADALSQLAADTAKHGWDSAKKLQSDAYHWLTDMVRFTEDDVRSQVEEINKRDVSAQTLWQDQAFNKYAKLAYSYADRAHVTGESGELLFANRMDAKQLGAYRTWFQFKTFKMGRLKNLADAFSSAGQRVADAYDLHAEGKLTDAELRSRVTPVVGEIWAPFSKQLASYTGHAMVGIVYKGLMYGLLHMIGNAIAGKQNVDEPYSVTRMKELITNLSGGLIPLTNEAEKGNRGGVLAAGGELLRTMTYDAGFFGLAQDFLQEQGRPFQKPTDALIPPSASTVLNLQSDFLNELSSRHKLEEQGKLPPNPVSDVAHSLLSAGARAVPMVRQTFPTKSSVSAKKPPVPKAGVSVGTAGKSVGANR